VTDSLYAIVHPQHAGLRRRGVPLAVRRFGEQLIEVSRTLARSGFAGGAA